MADTCSVITAQPAPANQMLVDVALRQGFQQTLKPVDRTTVMYDASIMLSYNQVALAPSQVFPATGSFNSSFLYIATDQPVQVQYTPHGGSTPVIITVNRLFLLDAAADTVTVSNPQPTQLTANVRIAYDGTTSSNAPSPSLIALLTTWSLAQAFQVVSGTRNSSGALLSATITWPDGGIGTYTADTLSTAFPGLVDAWHATYTAGNVTHTVTQPLVTRDSGGNITSQPALTIV